MLLKSQILFCDMICSKNKIFTGVLQWGMPICTFLAFLIYDIFCGIYDNSLTFLFTRWSTWNYMFFFALLFSMPKMVWNLRWTQAVIITVLSLWLWASILYYRHFHTNIPLSSYSQIFAVTNNYGNNITSLMQIGDLLFLLPVVCAWILATFDISTTCLGIKLYWIVLGLTFISSWVLSIVRHGFEGTFRNQITYTTSPAQNTPVGYLIYDAVKQIAPISNADSKKVEDWTQYHDRLFTAPTVKSEMRDKVLVILVESLDSWVVSAKVEGQQVMPNLNKLTTDSATLFAPRVVCQTKDGSSSDGEYILFSGILPLQTGAISLERHQSVKFSLPKAFSETRNIESFYFDGSPKTTWNKEATIPTLGFKNTLFKEDFSPQSKGNDKLKIQDEELCKDVVNRFQQAPGLVNGKSWFAEVVTITSHYDYLFPDGTKSTLHLNGNYPLILKNYLKIMRYVDDCIGQLIQYIKSRDDYDQISIVITGDHVAPKIDKYQTPFTDKEPLIPFLVVNSPVPGRFDKYMGQADMYTTLIDLFCPDYKHRGLGISILTPAHPGVAVGSDGKVYGNGSPDVVKHLTDAFEVSEIILRYDLWKDK